MGGPVLSFIIAFLPGEMAAAAAALVCGSGGRRISSSINGDNRYRRCGGSTPGEGGVSLLYFYRR